MPCAARREEGGEDARLGCDAQQPRLHDLVGGAHHLALRKGKRNPALVELRGEREHHVAHRVEVARDGCRGARLTQVVDRAVDLEPEQVALGAEVVEEGGPADSGASGDLVDGRAGVGVLDEQLGRGILDHPPRRYLGAPDARRLGRVAMACTGLHCCSHRD
jgi:hypothetical protein